VSAFFPFARDAETDADGRGRAERFWRPVARDSPHLQSILGRPVRSWRQRRSTGNLSWDMPAADLRAMNEARRVTGASQIWLFLAAMSVVLAGVTGTGFVPITYLRHGRAAARTPIGPLWETCITVPPDDADGGLASWISGFAAVNTAAPPMCGLALVDFAPLDTVMELRRFTVTVRLPMRSLAFGAARASAFDPPVPPPVAGDHAAVKHNFGIRLYPDGGRMALRLNFDPDEYRGEERIFTAVRHVLRAVLRDPAVPLGRVQAESARILVDERGCPG
jgi:hypothetical protein